MMLTISQYAQACGVSHQAIKLRIKKGLIITQKIYNKEMIDCERYPATKLKRGVKVGMKNALKKKK